MEENNVIYEEEINDTELVEECDDTGSGKIVALVVLAIGAIAAGVYFGGKKIKEAIAKKQKAKEESKQVDEESDNLYVFK